MPRFAHLMKPLKVRGFVLKNRMCAANSLPHFIQGPESFPADSVMAHYESKAKGAAIVTCMGINNNTRGKKLNDKMDFSHFPDYDLFDPASQNYLAQLAESIHFYHSLASMSIFAGPMSGFPVKRYRNGAVPPPDMTQGTPDMKTPPSPFDEYELEWIPSHKPVEEYTKDELEGIVESCAEQSVILKRIGFDMITVHMCYRGNLPSQFFSPLTNHRTDEYGGSTENRMRFGIDLLKGIRAAVGEHFLIEIQWSGEDAAGGYTFEESVAFLNEAKKYADIVQIRTGEVDPAHPIGFEERETPFLDLAGRIRERVDGVLIGAIGGFQDLTTCDRAIASGKCDLVYAARAFISNSDYGELLAEGRNEDIVPCVRCNKCHGRGKDDPFVSVCTVNPEIGLQHKIGRLVTPPRRKKRVAVIGGGPGGMRAALWLKQRGHTPVIFEKEGQLGGKIIHSDNVEFKWPLKRFKDHLIRKVGEEGIEVRLHTAPSPADIEAEGFDVCIAAIGATEKMPPVPGLDRHPDVHFAREVMEDPAVLSGLGKKCVVIGGGEVGTECGIFLARRGREVAVLEMRDVLCADSTAIHYYSMLQAAWEAEPLFSSVTGARVTGADAHAVYYTGRDGGQLSAEADSVIISAGMRPLTDEAIDYSGCAPEFYMAGDCITPATLQQVMRSVYGIVSMI